MELSEFQSLLESPINGLIKGLGNELKQLAKNRILEYQLIEYKRNYLTKTLLHRSEPIKLLDFYLPLHIAPYIDSCNGNQVEQRISTELVQNLFTKSNYITLIGSAGSGKSTIVKYLFIDSVKNKFKIPIKIELRYLNEYKSSITDYIFDEIFLFYKLGFSKTIIDRLLNSGSFIFFFDGYDEINSNKKETITKDIDRFVSNYSTNKYLITSRPYTNIDTLPLFSNFTVCDLLESEIPAFVKKQLPISDVELSDKMIKAISQIDNNSFKVFLSNPLLLAMFILTFQSYSQIPQKKSDFYKQVFDTLYSVHDSISKLSFVREKQSGLSKEGFEELLRLFSFLSYFDEKFLFQPDYLESKLTLIKEKKRSLEFDNQKVIEDLQIAIGILTKEGTDYAFPHRSLQEYFAANYISNLSESNKKIIFTKISKSIEKNWLYMFDNNHFLALLQEQDYFSYLNYLVLPLLEDQIKEVKKHQSSSIDVKYNLVCKIFLLSIDLLHSSSTEILIQQEYTKDYGPHSIYVHNRTTFKIPKKRAAEELKEQDLIRTFQFILSRGDEWIEDIKHKIVEQEKSDSDIIDII